MIRSRRSAPLVARTLFVVAVAVLSSSQWGCEGCEGVRSQTSATSGDSPGQDVARSGRIYASRDGGQSWRVSDEGIPEEATVNDFMAAGRMVLAATSTHGVFASEDEGATWRRLVANVGGNTAVNAILATDSVVLAGTRDGGVFASRDRGTTWTPANEGLANLEIRRLAAIEGRVFAATNGGLYVSTGDVEPWHHLVGAGQTNGVAGLRGDIYVADVEGVLVSRDAGEHWQRVYDQGTPHNLGSDGSSIFAMLYWRGVVRTRDGRTWEAAQQGLPADLAQYTFQIVHAEGKLYAGQWHGVYVSDSGGTSWRRSAGGLPPHLAMTDILRVSPDVLLAAAVASSAAR